MHAYAYSRLYILEPLGMTWRGRSKAIRQPPLGFRALRRPLPLPARIPSPRRQVDRMFTFIDPRDAALSYPTVGYSHWLNPIGICQLESRCRNLCNTCSQTRAFTLAIRPCNALCKSQIGPALCGHWTTSFSDRSQCRHVSVLLPGLHVQRTLHHTGMLPFPLWHGE
jgi:hypothetical protein